jgi:hypothetical protein
VDRYGLTLNTLWCRQILWKRLWCDRHSILVHWMWLHRLRGSLIHTICDIVLARRSGFRRNVRGPPFDWSSGRLRKKGVLSVLFYAWLCGDLFREAWAFLFDQLFKQTLANLVQNALLGNDKSDRFDHMLLPLGSGGVVCVNVRILSQRKRREEGRKLRKLKKREGGQRVHKTEWSCMRLSDHKMSRIIERRGLTYFVPDNKHDGAFV